MGLYEECWNLIGDQLRGERERESEGLVQISSWELDRREFHNKTRNEPILRVAIF